MANRAAGGKIEGAVYPMERIEEHRVDANGRVEYFIKWDGWSPKHNTWEPRENIIDMQTIIEYHKRNASAGGRLLGAKRRPRSDPYGSESSEDEPILNATKRGETKASLSSTLSKKATPRTPPVKKATPRVVGSKITPPKSYIKKGQEGNCSVCLGAHCFQDNPIVYCGRCNVGVHTQCYGYPLSLEIPDGEWICQRCRFKAGSEQCVLCPIKNGCMKKTTDGRWAHLACAMWVPEVFFRLGPGMEPIDTFQVARRRWRHQCYFCELRSGACVECSYEGCNAVFHVTCGMKHGVLLEYEVNKSGSDMVISFCAKHSSYWRRQRAKIKKKRKGVVRPRDEVS